MARVREDTVEHSWSVRRSDHSHHLQVVVGVILPQKDQNVTCTESKKTCQSTKRKMGLRIPYLSRKGPAEISLIDKYCRLE